jgi:cell division protein FtsL
VFKILLGLSALSLAGCGAFFSVKGIGLLFSGSFWSAVIMGSALEFGKIMATSFLYRYWEKINNIIKTYLLCAIFLLMGITSLGIFGFLSQAFYSTKSNVDAIESQVLLLNSKKNSLQTQLASNNNRIKILTDTRKNQESNLSKALDQSTTTTVTRSGGFFSNDKQETVIDKKSVELKNQSINSIQSNITDLESSILDLNKNNNNLMAEINNIDNQIIELNKQIVKSDIGTYKFIAEAFNIKIETVVKYFVLIIVIVFDPFAICLLMAYNVLAFRKETIISTSSEPKIIEKVIEKPINVVKEIYHEYKRGTKKSHNPELADPNIED